MSNVLVTGGPGTLGRAVIEKMLKLPQFRKIVVFSRDEAQQVQMASDPMVKNSKVEFFTGSITNRDALDKAVDKHDIDTIVHAAALKHVPICERHPSECIDTNVIGSRNVLDVARAYAVERVVLVSTDKASSPNNVYGLSKALMESLMHEYNSQKMLVNVARFGNLIGSRGSVLELFLRQAKSTGTVTVTNPEMTRFFIRIKQAADTVLYALQHKVGGFVFVPKMKAARLEDFVHAVFDYLHLPPKIKIIGARPGEKVHETIINKDEVSRVGVAEEFLGLLIGKDVLPEKRRAITKAITSDRDKKMDAEELLGMIQEIAPVVNDVLKV